MIRLQFVRGPDLASGAIAWFSAGPYSHVDAVDHRGNLWGARSDSVGGAPAGVQMRPANYADWPIKTVLTLATTLTQENAFWTFLNRQVGKPYDHSAIWGFAAGRDWRAPDSWFCSELQARALEVSGVSPQLLSPVSKITPVSLALVVTALGGTSA